MHTIHISFYILISSVILALIFDFMNGFHDAANAIATVVSTGVLKPCVAVALAAFFNLVAIFVFHQLDVAESIGKGMIQLEVMDHVVIFDALLSAIFWNIITWYYGIPSSSSHALIGGLAGAAIAKAGLDALIFVGLLKIIFFIVISPILGYILGSLMISTISRICARFSFTPRTIDVWFRRIQLFSASMYSLGHGGNDAQKTIGIIWMLLIVTRNYSNTITPPSWIIVSCYCAISLGTLLGGWRIVKTMGQKITKIKPIGGFCAEVAGAATLFIATASGAPVSTTQTITGAIVGVGSTRKTFAVRWGLVRNIVSTWLLTIPTSAVMAFILWWINEFIH